MISNQILWAKLGQNTTGAIVRWHSLVDHSADVAAVVESLLAPSTLRRRLAKVADVRRPARLFTREPGASPSVDPSSISGTKPKARATGRNARTWPRPRDGRARP